MTAFDFSATERRRSVRTKLVIPLRVHGQTRMTTGHDLGSGIDTTCSCTGYFTLVSSIQASARISVGLLDSTEIS